MVQLHSIYFVQSRSKASAPPLTNLDLGDTSLDGYDVVRQCTKWRRVGNDAVPALGDN